MANQEHLKNLKQKVNSNLQKWSILAISLCLSNYCQGANALPGEAPRDVASWIASHPTLSPASSANGLFVQKTNTAAQRFTFQAFPQSSFRDHPRRNRGSLITSERFAFFDMINGVTIERLEETLRTIYGSNIDQDYQNAQVTYTYPTPETLELARRQGLPLLASQQGELRLGENFAYWIEVTNTDTGIAYNGHLQILLKEDLFTLQSRINSRSMGSN